MLTFGNPEDKTSSIANLVAKTTRVEIFGRVVAYKGAAFPVVITGARLKHSRQVVFLIYSCCSLSVFDFNQLAMHQLAAAGRSRLETEPKIFMFETSCKARCSPNGGRSRKVATPDL